jgi:hypothetical protein
MASILQDVKLAADWIAQALASSGYRADFSLESLREVDRFLQEHAPGGRPKRGVLLAEDFGNRLFSLGAYVGEVIRRRNGGEWQGDDSDPEAEVNVAVRLAGGAVVWPVRQVMKRCKHGPGESIYNYGLALGAA